MYCHQRFKTIRKRHTVRDANKLGMLLDHRITVSMIRSSWFWVSPLVTVSVSRYSLFGCTGVSGFINLYFLFLKQFKFNLRSLFFSLRKTWYGKSLFCLQLTWLIIHTKLINCKSHSFIVSLTNYKSLSVKT